MSTVKFFRHSTKLFKYHIPTEFVVLAIFEFFILIASLYLAYVFRFWNNEWTFMLPGFAQKALVFAFVLQLSLLAFGVYQRQTGKFMNLLLLRIASGLLLGLVPLGVSYYFFPAFFLGRGALFIAVALSFVFISAGRLTF
jgi:FlaA1/EpsC-like NDP-sugar epimerase